MAKRSVAAIIGLGIGAFAPAPGSAIIAGFVIDPTLAEGIQVGVDNKDSVTKHARPPDLHRPVRSQ